MAKSRASEQIPDDIDLLNIHRYPDSVSPSLMAQVRNSKICQKRLEELVKALPGRRATRGGGGGGSNPNVVFQEKTGEPNSETESDKETASSSLKAFKKNFSVILAGQFA